MSDPRSRDDFTHEKHVQYFKRHLVTLPEDYTETETNRMTLAFFCLGSLELLGALDTAISEENKCAWIDWIYAQQILPTRDDDSNAPYCGFSGSSWSGRQFSPSATCSEHIPFDSAHIANTYTALINLLILGDDLSRVNAKAILHSIHLLQQEDGSIAPNEGSLERDVRFIFCASAICYILNDWSPLNTDALCDYIKRLQSYEYGIGQSPDQESHGGSTFCGVASLTLLGKQQEGLLNREKLIQWCLMRQTTGFAGRPNKDADTCYCFWIGASLHMLDSFSLVNDANLRGFMMETQTKHGGFGKNPKAFPDLLHSYMGITTLSLLNEPGIGRVNTALNAPESVMERMKNTIFWKSADEHP